MPLIQRYLESWPGSPVRIGDNVKNCLPQSCGRQFFAYWEGIRGLDKLEIVLRFLYGNLFLSVFFSGLYKSKRGIQRFGYHIFWLI